MHTSNSTNLVVNHIYGLTTFPFGADFNLRYTQVRPHQKGIKTETINDLT
jgi:hypothetical protein